PSSDSLLTATHVAIKYTDDFIPDPSRVYPESVSNLILRRFQSKRKPESF
ncbi:unnamed protein product, partial [Brassica oleracea var. botrytis]